MTLTLRDLDAILGPRWRARTFACVFCFYANLGRLVCRGSFVDIVVLVRYAGSKELQSIPSRKM